MKYFFQLIILILIVGCKNQDEDFSFTQNSSQKIELPPQILDSLKGGELIIRKGDGFLSQVLVDLMADNLNYSHAGIVIKHDTNLFIIHSLSDEVSHIDGVQTSTFPYFIADVSDSSLCIIRPKVSQKELNLIQLKALEYLKKQFPFDHGFDNTTKDEFHCIEMVHDILYSVLNREILPEKKRFGKGFYSFTSFFDTTNFELVYELYPYSKAIQ